MFKGTDDMTTQYNWGLARQRGSALIVALVFLLVMTLIGTTAMQGTSQQESMAGNTRNRNLAFQAAEAALRDAENALDGGATGIPLVPVRDWMNYPWATATTYLNVLNEVFAQPQYVIENVGWVTSGGIGENLAVGAIGGMGSEFYRITARGLGGTADAVVILQTTYRR
jgi:type IV pilus assembly protein PilX